MGMCRKVEDAARQSRAELYKASLFDTGRDVARRKSVAAALESYNNLMTKYPAHESILKPLVSGLEGTNESHIHGRCHDYYANQVKTAASGAPAAAASAAASQAARPTALCNCKKPGGVKGKSVERCCRRAGHGDGVGHDFDKKRRERVVSRILLLMARPGQATGPLFRPVGEAVEMECMQAFREEW